MDISRLSNAELHARAKKLAAAERGAVADLVEHLAEIDRRRIYCDLGCNSLFEYCVHALACSHGAAYRRIRGARAVQVFPAVGELLREGKLTLESIVLLHPFLDDPDAAALIVKASGMKTAQVQELLAGRNLDEPRRDVIRFVAPPIPAPPVPLEESAPLLAVARQADEKTFSAMAPPPPPAPAAPSMPKASAPSTPPSVRIAFTADHEFYKLMKRAQAVLRHKYPDGRLEGVLKDALVALLKRRDRSFGWK